MVDKELRNHIEKYFKKNSSVKKLRAELISLGWKYYEINEALEEFNDKSDELAPPKKSNFFKIFLFVFILIVLFGIFYYLFYFQSSTKQEIYLDNSTMLNGVLLPVMGDSKINFYYNGENLSFTITSINFKDFNFKRDEDIKVGLGEEKYIDLNGDSKSDIYVRGVITGVGKINLFIQNLDLIGCPENWYCSSWNSCFEESQNRSCVDRNFCQTEVKKPILIQKCVETPPVVINKSISNNEGASVSSSSKNKPQKQPNLFEDLTNYSDCGFENSTIVNDCFIQAVDECNKSKLTSKIELSYEGFLFNSTNLFAIKEDSNNFCYYYQKNLNSFLEFSLELVEELISQGYSQEEISNEEKDMNESAQNFVGLWTQCSFSKENLKQVFQNWKNGDYQGGENCDFVNGELYCQYSGDFSSAESCNSGI